MKSVIEANLKRLSQTKRDNIAEDMGETLDQLCEDQDLFDFDYDPVTKTSWMIRKDKAYRIDRDENVFLLGDAVQPEDEEEEIPTVDDFKSIDGEAVTTGRAQIINVYRSFMDIRASLGNTILKELNKDIPEPLTFFPNKVPGKLFYENSQYQVLFDIKDQTKDEIIDLV
jgi:predicted secreted protein